MKKRGLEPPAEVSLVIETDSTYVTVFADPIDAFRFVIIGVNEDGQLPSKYESVLDGVSSWSIGDFMDGNCFELGNYRLEMKQIH